MTVMEDGSICLAAPAKINLNLLVGPRRGDGYHPIDSFVARVSLYDRVLLRRGDDQIRFTCRGANCGPDEGNLALRAAKLLRGRSPGRGADIELSKNIPVGGGLGGGSSDAAAVLEGLSELWELGLSSGELADLGASLGSDVPLFFGQPSARITGRGEHVAPVAVHPFWAVLCVPDVSCTSAEVYASFDAEAENMGEQLDPAILGQRPSVWRGALRNQLTAAAERLHSALSDIRRSLSARAGIPACLTGSGSAMFILCDSREEAEDVRGRMEDQWRHRCFVVGCNPW